MPAYSPRFCGRNSGNIKVYTLRQDGSGIGVDRDGDAELLHGGHCFQSGTLAMIVSGIGNGSIHRQRDRTERDRGELDAIQVANIEASKIERSEVRDSLTPSRLPTSKPARSDTNGKTTIKFWECDANGNAREKRFGALCLLVLIGESGKAIGKAPWCLWRSSPSIPSTRRNRDDRERNREVARAVLASSSDRDWRLLHGGLCFDLVFRKLSATGIQLSSALSPFRNNPNKSIHSIPARK